ncbi:MAG TPA: hypothetical protein VFX18_01420 [Candidatus Nitrosocosmicus sp.]|nr:hypothetical protein [Candidatus Nitrosocosmicus sp.]
MNKKRNLFYVIVLVMLTGISALTIALWNNDNSVAEAKIEIKNNQFLNNFTKINVSLKKKFPNSYSFKNLDLHNGDLLLLNRKNEGLDLKKGDYVDIDLSIIPDGYSATAVGYILNGKYTEIFLDSVYDQLTASFDVEEAGKYIICIVGGNASFITIKDGLISIN